MDARMALAAEAFDAAARAGRLVDGIAAAAFVLDLDLVPALNAMLDAGVLAFASYTRPAPAKERGGGGLFRVVDGALLRADGSPAPAGALSWRG